MSHATARNRKPYRNVITNTRPRRRRGASGQERQRGQTRDSPGHPSNVRACYYIIRNYYYVTDHRYSADENARSEERGRSNFHVHEASYVTWNSPAACATA